MTGQEQSTPCAGQNPYPVGGHRACASGDATCRTVRKRFSNDPQGKRFVGSAIWRTETVSSGAGLAPELVVRADVKIPDRRMSITWSLRCNTDKALPASHTIEIMFNLPADFPGGGVANAPGVLMKQTEKARGTPLAGLSVKVTNGFFLIGLSAIDADRQRNMHLLKIRSGSTFPSSIPMAAALSSPWKRARPVTAHLPMPSRHGESSMLENTWASSSHLFGGLAPAQEICFSDACNGSSVIQRTYARI